MFALRALHVPPWCTPPHSSRAPAPSLHSPPPTHPHPPLLARSYDPSKFRDLDRMDDRAMEAGWGQIEAEERRALRIARTEDER